MLSFGLLLLFFLPVIESYHRQAGLFLLCLGAVLISFNLFWRKKLYLDIISFFFLLFILRGLVSTVFSWSIAKSFIEASRYIAYFLIFTAFREEARIKNMAIRYLTLFSVINSLLLSFLYLFYVFRGRQLLPGNLGMNLFYPVFGHNRIADMLILAVPLLAGLSVQAELVKRKFHLTLLIWYFLIFLFLSLGRGAWWSLVGAIIFSVYLFPQLRIQIRSVWKTAGIFVPAAIIMTIGIFLNSQYDINKFENKNLLKGLYKPIYQEKRIEYFSQAIKGFSISPLRGTGLDTFRYVSREFQKNPGSWSWYAHNQLLQLLSDSGFTGSVVFLVLMALLFRNTIGRLKISGNIMEFWIFLAILASTFHSLIDYNWQFISILFFVFAGFATLLSNHKDEKGATSRLLFAILTCLMISGAVVSFVDSEFMFNKADRLTEKGMNRAALTVLDKAAEMDSHNSEVFIRAGYIYEVTGETEMAHYNYQRAISLVPLELDGLKATDYLLYLAEADKLIKNYKINSANRVIQNSIRVYPDFYQNYNIVPMLPKDPEGFIKEMRKRIEEVRNRV